MADFGTLNFAVAFNPQTAFPLDARYYFASLSDAEAAAAAAVEVGSSEGTYFFGENICVVEDDKASLYIIQPDKTLKPVGSEVVADDKSVEIADGKVSVKGAGEATAGQQPRINAAGDGIEWYTPDTTTVSGLADTIAGHTKDIESLQNNKADKSDVYTKAEVDGKIGSVYKPAGSSAFADLPAAEAAILGNVYNVADDFTTTDAFIEGAGKQYSAGTNVVVVQDGEDYKYDVLAGLIDTTNFVTKEDGKGLSSNDFTAADKEKLDKLTGDEEANYIKSASDEFAVSDSGGLSVSSIEMGKVSGLAEALADKVSAEAGKGLSTNDFTTEAKEKLDGIENNAKDNLIEVIKLNGVALNIAEKSVDIPMATAEKLGVVLGSAEENKVSVGEDGTMEVNSINVNKLVQTEGDVLILDGGNASA